MPRNSVGALALAGDEEPSRAELTALAYETPVIAAELALLAAETDALDRPGCPAAAARVRRARWSVITAQLAVIVSLAVSLVGPPTDWGEAPA
ncbi:MAG: DUF6284 family protein [Micromonosporaceae bacterium]